MSTESAKENNNLTKETIQWGYRYLSSHGYELKSNLPANIKNTHWSYVVRFATSNGYVYLKHTPKLLALEPVIIPILHNQFRASVPEIIADNAELNCFLMKDAGIPLREVLKQEFDEALLCKAIDQFTSLQIAVSDHVDVLLDIGVPDWRLNKLPDLYKDVILQKDLLIADGLSETEIHELERLHPVVSNLCQKLSDYSIKQTIVQPDFNDNNTLINNVSQDITTIDLGEISISHPFFSLLNFLQQIRKHHGLTENDDIYLRIKDVCFKNFINFESKNGLFDMFATVETVWIVYGILAQYRLMLACGKEKIMSFQPGRLSASLKEFIIACTRTGNHF